MNHETGSKRKFVQDIVRRELMQVICNKGRIDNWDNIKRIGETAGQFYDAMKKNSKKPQEK